MARHRKLSSALSGASGCISTMPPGPDNRKLSAISDPSGENRRARVCETSTRRRTVWRVVSGSRRSSPSGPVTTPLDAKAPENSLASVFSSSSSDWIRFCR
jgi:hypothetical protein